MSPTHKKIFTISKLKLGLLSKHPPEVPFLQIKCSDSDLTAAEVSKKHSSEFPCGAPEPLHGV